MAGGVAARSRRRRPAAWLRDDAGGCRAGCAGANGSGQSGSYWNRRRGI
ncbi:hypothetical protein M8494_03620 [Serratia ureilytica]